MTCDGLKGTLLTADELSPAARAHLASCSACRAAAERWHEVQAALRAGQAETPPPFLHARIMAGVRAARQEQAPWWRALPRTAWAGAAVAVLVVGIVAIHGGWRATRPDRTPSLVESFAPDVTTDVRDTTGGPEPAEATAPHLARESGIPAAHTMEEPRTIEAPPAPATAVRTDAPPEPAAPRGARPEARPAEPPPAPAAAAPPAPPVVVVEEEVSAPRARAEVRTAADQPAAEFQTLSQRSRRGPAPEQAERLESAPAWAPEQGRPAESLEGSVPVMVRPVSAAGGPTRLITIEAAAAPPAGKTWIVVIGRDGEVLLEGPPEDTLDALARVYRRALADLDFPPGRYRAARPQP